MVFMELRRLRKISTFLAVNLFGWNCLEYLMVFVVFNQKVAKGINSLDIEMKAPVDLY